MAWQWNLVSSSEQSTKNSSQTQWQAKNVGQCNRHSLRNPSDVSYVLHRSHLKDTIRYWLVQSKRNSHWIMYAWNLHRPRCSWARWEDFDDDNMQWKLNIWRQIIVRKHKNIGVEKWVPQRDFCDIVEVSLNCIFNSGTLIIEIVEKYYKIWRNIS